MADAAERGQSWRDRLDELQRLERLQLFFVGGAPRSGTTWLQQMLDCHPDISCRGEALFSQQLAAPLERLFAERRKTIEAKNRGMFGHTGGYPLPAGDEVDVLVGTAILMGLRQQCAARPCRAVGEKTPENVFIFPRLKRLFPEAKFVGIARDPRDLLTSAWHYFHQARAEPDETAAKIAFIRRSLPSLVQGARQLVALQRDYPADCATVTYETLRRAPAEALARLFRFLGVPDGDAVVADCLARTAFARQTGGRPAGVEQNGAFLRKGVVGDWQVTLTPEMNAIIMQELGWMFPLFGWLP